MKWCVPIALLGVCVSPRPSAGSDLSEALRVTREVMGKEAVAGLEQFIDDDPNEALGLLLARELGPVHSRPGQTSRRRERAPFRQLGRTRLNYRSVAAHLDEATLKTGLPAALLDAVIRTESGYRPRAVSSAGAIGLMQLMPATARALGVSDPFEPRQNILGGARYLRRMYDRFGSLSLAIAAYNAGPGAVAKHGGIPPFAETQRYVQVVLDRFEKSPIR